MQYGWDENEDWGAMRKWREQSSWCSPPPPPRIINEFCSALGQVHDGPLEEKNKNMMGMAMMRPFILGTLYLQQYAFVHRQLPSYAGFSARMRPYIIATSGQFYNQNHRRSKIDLSTGMTFLSPDLMVIGRRTVIGDIHKRHLQNFRDFWPPPPCLCNWFIL